MVFPVDDDPQRHLVITLQHLDIPQEFGYLALVLDDHATLYTIPHSMIKYYHNHYRPEMASQIKTYAKDQGKRVWVHCYIQQGRELNDAFFDAVEADDRIGGILLYEVADALILATGPQRGYHQANVPLLRSLMKRLQFD